MVLPKTVSGMRFAQSARGRSTQRYVRPPWVWERMRHGSGDWLSPWASGLRSWPGTEWRGPIPRVSPGPSRHRRVQPRRIRPRRPAPAAERRRRQQRPRHRASSKTPVKARRPYRSRHRPQIRPWSHPRLLMPKHPRRQWVPAPTTLKRTASDISRRSGRKIRNRLVTPPIPSPGRHRAWTPRAAPRWFAHRRRRLLRLSTTPRWSPTLRATDRRRAGGDGSRRSVTIDVQQPEVSTATPPHDPVDGGHDGVIECGGRAPEPVRRGRADRADRVTGDVGIGGGSATGVLDLGAEPRPAGR